MHSRFSGVSTLQQDFQRHLQNSSLQDGAGAQIPLSKYQSGWKKWHSWCIERKVDPFLCDIQSFLDFLASLYEEGSQHWSINTIRSAVSMTHRHIEGDPIGQHPSVTQLLKGVYNTSPLPNPVTRKHGTLMECLTT